MQILVAAAENRGLLAPILVGIVLGLLIGFVYAAARRALGRRRR